MSRPTSTVEGAAGLIDEIDQPTATLWSDVWRKLKKDNQFRVAVVAYSAIFSLTVLPRGLGLPPGTVLQIYLGSIAAFVASMAIILAIAWRTKVFRLR